MVEKSHARVVVVWGWWWISGRVGYDRRVFLTMIPVRHPPQQKTVSCEGWMVWLVAFFVPCFLSHEAQVHCITISGVSRFLGWLHMYVYFRAGTKNEQVVSGCC